MTVSSTRLLHPCSLLARLLMVAALLFSAFPLLAQDWTYRVRPGDTLWDLGSRYLKPSVPWQHLQSHNRVSDPYRLPPGSQLRFPVAWLAVQPVPARVLALRGPVQVGDAARGGLRDVIEGELLTIGQHLVTGADASVTLVFADDSRLQLRENSRLRLDQLSRYGHTGMVDTRVRLQQGRTSNRVTPATGPASRYIIDAPTATSSVRGTVFRVSAGGDGRSAATEVLQGKVQVGNPRGQRLVTRGRGHPQHIAGHAPGRTGAVAASAVAGPGAAAPGPVARARGVDGGGRCRALPGGGGTCRPTRDPAVRAGHHGHHPDGARPCARHAARTGPRGQRRRCGRSRRRTRFRGARSTTAAVDGAPGQPGNRQQRAAALPVEPGRRRRGQRAADRA
ncbi:FecR domain-containing protein [Stenotrophomonas rhizophila]